MNLFRTAKSAIHSQLSADELIQATLARGEGSLNDTGALCISAGKFTHRSPKIAFVVIIAFLGLAVNTVLYAQKTWPLYEGKIPNSKNCPDKEIQEATGRKVVRNVTVPTLSVYMPEKRGYGMAAIIICPGGGYSNLSIEDGGKDAAQEFASQGVVAFVLKYRTSDPSCNINNEYVAFQDLQEAILQVKSKAASWNIDPAKVGVLGFSAGGHLASLASTQYRRSMVASGNLSLRPAFTILAYPVISFTEELTSPKTKTRQNLLGDQISAEQIRWFSPEQNVDSNTPPAFLLHASDDSTALVGNSIAYYQSLNRSKVPAEMTVYQKGGHGFATFNKAENDHWVIRAVAWLRLNGFLI
jgi:acetyl esterase/lipase